MASNSVLKGKENKPGYNPDEHPVAMAQTIVNLNGRITDLLRSNNDLLRSNDDLTTNNLAMKETITKLEDMVKVLSEKMKNLEEELKYERKLRLGDSDSSNSPPLINK